MGIHEHHLIAHLAATLDPTDIAAYAHFAIRTRSPLARQVLHAAGEGAALGRVTALSGEPDAHQRGLAMLDDVVARSGVTWLPGRALTTWAELLLLSGRDEELHALLEDPHVALPYATRWRLRTDLLNPYRRTWDAESTSGAAVEPLESGEREWLDVFNEVHAADSLDPIRLRPAEAGDSPYQRLEAPVADRVDGDLVTVVMSAYAPDRDLLLAVRGVIQQTWRNLELLVVDDASPPGSQDLLEEAEALDPRVRVIRAPRNRGTYEARNLALAIAQGRWMTFQDSDDWTHPRRVEHQVRHLQESPTVLANRTWTLRAYEDLTMTLPGASATRLNASSLLFDRVQVTQLVGAFDSTRKAADSELPSRLEAVRPGSLQDLRPPASLAITQLRAGSLSRSDFLPGWQRWDRIAYLDSYVEWHRQITAGRSSAVLPIPSGRPFPLPRAAWQPDRAMPTKPAAWDVVLLGDLRQKGHRARRVLGAARTSAHAGLRTAVAHAEAPYPISGRRSALLPAVARDVRLGLLGRTNCDEDDEGDLLVIIEPASVLHVDQVALKVRNVLIVVDDPTPEGWSVAVVDRRCQELFGVAPWWGGPAQVHGRPEDPSAVRVAVPDERWCGSDLSTVAGDKMHRVGTPAIPRPLHRRRSGTPSRSTLVVGHHLPDGPRRWPDSADAMWSAYPEQLTFTGRTGERAETTLPCELHGLQGLNRPVAIMGYPMRPPSWVSFAGTGLTVREFLSHIDVWVYFGEWDTQAEIAALEALGAGLPCLLGEDAAVSGLEGPVRCVPPARAQEALTELLTDEADGNDSSATRQDEWARTLHRLMTTNVPASSQDRVDRLVSAAVTSGA